MAPAGIFGSALLALALAGRWPDVLPWSLALLGGQYALSLVFRDSGVDGLAPVYAALLLVTAELAYWALDAAPALGGIAIVGRRLGTLVLLALGTAAAGAFLLAVSEGGEGASFALQVLGLAAAAGTLALLTWLAWRARAR